VADGVAYKAKKKELDKCGQGELGQYLRPPNDDSLEESDVISGLESAAWAVCQHKGWEVTETMQQMRGPGGIK
jgi:hypothetical protein